MGARSADTVTNPQAEGWWIGKEIIRGRNEQGAAET